MHSRITTLFNHIHALESFLEKYPAIDNHMLSMSNVSPRADRPPMVSIDGQHPASKQWALATFGAEGVWTTRRIDNGFQTVGAVIDGVELQIWRAYPVKVVDCGRATVPAYLLTGKECGIDLPAEVVA